MKTFIIACMLVIVLAAFFFGIAVVMIMFVGRFMRKDQSDRTTPPNKDIWGAAGELPPRSPNKNIWG